MRLSLLFFTPLLFVAADADAAARPAITIAGATANAMGTDYVGVTVVNGSSSEQPFTLFARAAGATKDAMHLGAHAIPARDRQRVALHAKWPRRCVEETMESRVWLEGADVDPAPRLLRIRPAGWHADYALLDDPVKKDGLSPADLARKSAGHVYYRSPAIVTAPKACDDQVTLRAELVNATAATIHHAKLVLLQAEAISAVDVTLAPGESRVVEGTARWKGVPISLQIDATTDVAGTQHLPLDRLHFGYMAGLGAYATSAMVVELVPAP